MSGHPNIKVFICNLAGEYLAGDGDEWLFTSNRTTAHVFDYHADAVVLQLEQTRRELGVVWVAVPVDPQLAGETCDVCGQRLPAIDAIFDGTRFFCPACRAISRNSRPWRVPLPNSPTPGQPALPHPSGSEQNHVSAAGCQGIT